MGVSRISERLANRDCVGGDNDLRLYATMVDRGGFGIGFDDARLGKEWRELPPEHAGLQIDYEYGRVCALELRVKGLPLDAWESVKLRPDHPLFDAVLGWAKKPDIREIIAEFKSRRCRGRLASCGEIAAIAEALLSEMDRRGQDPAIRAALEDQLARIKVALFEGLPADEFEPVWDIIETAT